MASSKPLQNLDTKPSFSISRLMVDAFGLMGHGLLLLYLGLALILLLGQLSPPAAVQAEGGLLPVLFFYGMMLAWMLALITLLQLPVYRLALRWFAFHPNRTLPSPPWAERCLAFRKSTAVETTDEETEYPKSADALQEKLVKEGAQPLRLFRYLLPGLGELFVPIALGQGLQFLFMAFVWGLVGTYLWATVLNQPSLEVMQSWVDLPWESIAQLESSSAMLAEIERLTNGALTQPSLEALGIGIIVALSLVLLFQALTLLWQPYVVVWRFNVLRSYKLALSHWKLDTRGLFGLILWLGGGFVLVEGLTNFIAPSVWSLLAELLWFLFYSLVLCMYVVSQTGSPDLLPLAQETLEVQESIQNAKTQAHQDTLEKQIKNTDDNDSPQAE